MEVLQFLQMGVEMFVLLEVEPSAVMYVVVLTFGCGGFASFFLSFGDGADVVGAVADSNGLSDCPSELVPSGGVCGADCGSELSLDVVPAADEDVCTVVT